MSGNPENVTYEFDFDRRHPTSGSVPPSGSSNPRARGALSRPPARRDEVVKWQNGKMAARAEPGLPVPPCGGPVRLNA
ncbi:hypothetical protein VTN49DRAFT_5487 [Thermomyces lanuginosus]|uniref:uncharacterized protein n=1 Tax=Thermomyces lanuginosus TaxID=5541 RepID=UPI0037447F29